VTDEKSTFFPYDQYILKTYNDFVEAGGGQAIVIKYNIKDEELYPLLD
jgi:hypothetical protein